jgi:hypothetical protein
MGWLRLDDAFGDHPKVIGLSDRAFRAHVEGLVYCARYLTDGQVPKAKGPVPRVAVELERAGLWSSTKRGWVIHDFLDYNPSKAEVEADREARSAQRSIAGKARAAGAQRVGGRFAPAEGQQTISEATSGPVVPRSTTVTSGAPAPAPTRPLPQEQGQEPSTPRKRDEIADTLARIEGGNPLEVPPSHMRTLCVKANELRKVAPDVTSAEVERRAANWPGHMHDATISGPAVVKHWARLAQPAKPTAATNHPLDRMARDLIEGVNANGDRGSTSSGATPTGELPRVAGE